MRPAQTLTVTLKRSPRSITVGDHSVVIETARDEDVRDDRSESSQDQSGAAVPSEHVPRSSDLPRSMSTSVATVITDPSDRIVTPLAQSLAVPVLSATTHEVLSADSNMIAAIDSDDIRELKALLADAVEAVLEFQEQHRQSLSEIQEVAVELAAAAASWLVGVAIERDLFAIDDLILRALQQMEPDQPVRVRLHPDDHSLLRRLMKDRSSTDLLNQLVCEDAPEFTRGTCRVESGRKILLSDLNSRMEDIRRSWRETLDDSQVERRGDDSAASALRRFPDRRETA